MAPRKIERGTQLLVEGNDELNFFEAFTAHLSIEDVQIQAFDGSGNLRGFLAGLVRLPDFRTVRSIGVVRDADESADGAFRSVRDALRNAGLPAPDRPTERVGENPSVSVFVLPGGGNQGMLEALLCRTFEGTATDRCIDTFFQCAEAAGDAVRRPDKARAHAWLATRPEPHVSVGVAAKKGYWKLEHDAFGEVGRFLLSL